MSGKLAFGLQKRLKTGGEGQVCQDFDHFRKNCTRLSPQWNEIKKAVNYVE